MVDLLRVWCSDGIHNEYLQSLLQFYLLTSVPELMWAEPAGAGGAGGGQGLG